jgi:hypothetical protein
MRLQRVGEGMSPAPLSRFASTGHGVRPHRKMYQILYFYAPPLQQ